MRRLGLVAVASLELMLIVGLSIPGEAMMVKRSLVEQVEVSDYIVTGTVIGQESREASFKGIPLMYTEVTLRVDHCAKHLPEGSEPAYLTVRIPGGKVGLREVIASETPTFRQGELTVALLQRLDARTCRLAHGEASVYRLIADPVSRQGVVVDAAGQPLSVEDRRDLGLPPTVPPIVPHDLFLQRLEELVQRHQSQRERP